MRKKGILLIPLAVVLMLLIVAIFVTVNNSLSDHLQQNAEARLQETIDTNITSFNMQMNEQIKKVKTFADFLGENGTLGDKGQISLLKAAVKNNGLLRCAIAFPDGSFVTHDNKNKGNVSKEPFFKANMKGDFYITDPKPAIVDSSKTVILFSCPITKNGKVIGSVIYSYLCDDLNKLFNLNFMEDQGQMLVISKEGELLIGERPLNAKKGNVLDLLKKNYSHEDHNQSECFRITDNSGNFSATLKTQPLYIHYDKLEFNDWYMLSIVPEDLTIQTISLVTKSQKTLGIAISSCAVAYFVIVFALWVIQRRFVDKLTGAYTADSFKRRARRILSGKQTKDYVVVKLDVKDFKLINRIHSFEIGNQVIRNISNALKEVLKEKNTLFARVSTDGFVILLPYEGPDLLQKKRELFIRWFRQLMGGDFHTIINFPTGQYVLRPEDFPKPDIDEILEKVNFAHRAAKQKFDTIIDYEEDIEREALLEKAIEDRMQDALENQEFTLYLQPKYRTDDETICGAEALVRWKVGEHFFMHPTDFIPALERNGFIIQLDKYMFRCAAQKIREIIDKGETPVPISVNFSRYHLNNLRFVDELCEIADQCQVPHKYLEIELTESAIFEHVHQISKLIEQLHRAGFSVSMDDFGSGYSSLSQLKELNVDVLKIDKGFFAGKDEDRMWVVISNVLQMAQQLNIITVAEGIENQAQAKRLQDLKCDIIQGFYYSKPVIADEFSLSE